jgi:hypothetical protein
LFYWSRLDGGRLDIARFRSKVRTRLCNVMELNLD